ncbi:MAG: hypothetical protein EOR30_01500 [Mesorhizobium sp.]|uniref:hypothetical protein n=1 Tax=unclassified Mesorhizobium TaxID=325217 RepID=UPI000FCC41D3|nr:MULTISPECIES: hypothetical protein [unclassified Mesorhizobium]RUV73905.1 hypothetical protein EOA78_10500 [Mesorhizobium sp. M5C.F.Cr.IN.023.01.1.1]RWF89240.1 MAG: hypothetical protein EOQ36_05330 [Mesorhizobium sp.]RWF97144.1 MAG: hypothetical protein EOQ45_00955 [Mesorhizobium sp.]RWI42599.1 MAG: hypothetical protein EOR14_05615 [Mesorhizobium sp.]RWI53336.1 MAG: hypothetical protein EOR15_00930 [Mesorhizobium sp.]
MLRLSSLKCCVAVSKGNEQRRGGPLRYDIALTHYLEKQRACRVSTVGPFDFWIAAIRACALIPRLGRDISRDRVPSTHASVIKMHLS